MKTYMNEIKRMQFLAGVITEGQYKNSLDEDSLSEDVSDDEIEKAVAAALKISPDQVVDHEPSEEEKVNEAAGILGTIAFGISVAGLVPTLLTLLGDKTNEIYKRVGLSPEEQIELRKLDKFIKEKEKYIANLDAKNDPKEDKERKKLDKALHLKDKKFGDKTGNKFKKWAHKLHGWYIIPILKTLQFTAWTAEKFGKKTELSDPEYREKVANIVYAVIMALAAGYGAIDSLLHLKGVTDVATFIGKSVKAGKSTQEIIKGALLLI